MPIPVSAPRLGVGGVSECNSDDERRFLERLNARAAQGGWRTDSWSHDHVLLVLWGHPHNNRDTRVDYFGDRLLMGGNETGQYVTDLDPASPDVTLVTTGTPEEMADAAADRLEAHLPGGRYSQTPRPDTSPAAAADRRRGPLH